MKRLVSFPSFTIFLILVSSCTTGKSIQKNDSSSVDIKKTASSEISDSTLSAETGKHSWEAPHEPDHADIEKTTPISTREKPDRGQNLMSKGVKKGGWLIFGNGVLDSSVNTKAKEIMIDIDWGESTWGIGCMYDLGTPVGDKKVKSIDFQVKTHSGSRTSVYPGVATKDDANLVHPRPFAKNVTQEWQELMFDISKMIADMPNANSREFGKDDHQKIQLIKILFTKPTATSSKNDRILIQNPQLNFEQ